MPKASESARRERRVAERRLATGYAWPAKRRRIGGLPPAAAAALIVLVGIMVAVALTWRP